MIWQRRFRNNPRGIGTAFRLVGKPIFRRYARQTLESLSQLETDQPGAQPA
jgi:hypothetical protein